jgi:hypothetical protein
MAKTAIKTPEPTIRALVAGHFAQVPVSSIRFNPHAVPREAVSFVRSWFERLQGGNAEDSHIPSLALMPDGTYVVGLWQ